MRAHGLEPDAFVVGKAVGGGLPVGLYGVSEAVAQALWAQVPKTNPARVRQSAHLGFGGTLAGSALQVAPVPPRNATEFAAGRDGMLEALLHVHFLNRGVLITPFHCMMLVCPATRAEHVERFATVLDDFCTGLVAQCAVKEV